MKFETMDGKKILLDIEGLRADRPNISSLYNMLPFAFCLFTLLPFILLFGARLSTGLSSIIIVFLIGSTIFFLRRSTFTRRDPMGFDNARLFAMSSWTFYPGAILWAELSSLPRTVLVLIALMWLISEFISQSILKGISDQEVVFTFNNSFREGEFGNILYNPVSERPKLYFNPSSRGVILWAIEILPAFCLGVLGPYLYLKSFLLRGNLEPRFMIAFAFSLAFAAMTRTVTTEYYLVRRALRLKILEK